MVLKRWFILMLLVLPLASYGQVEDAMEQWLLDDGEENMAADWHDRLAELTDNPANINDTTHLAQIPFMTPFRIQALKNYIRLYGELLSVKELRYVPGFDSSTLALIAPLVKAAPCTRKGSWRIWQGHHSLTTGIGGTVEQAQGYSNGRYEGDNLRALLCYSYNYHNKVQLRLTADKDPTEAWDKGNYYGYHLMLNDIGPVEKLIVGRYNLRFGQGVTLWTGLRPFDITGTTPARFGTGVRQAGAFNEEDYQEGIAATVNLWRRLHLSGFASQTDGVRLLGGHAEWRGNNHVIGLTVTHSALGDSLAPRDYVYNQNAFRGTSLLNAGIDGTWQHGRTLIYGEAAMSNNGKPAATAGVDLSISDKNRLSANFRYYHPQYHNLHSSGYSLGNTQGEQGVRLDAQSQLPLNLHGLLSLDLYRFTSLRYANYRPSSGAWLRAQLERQFGGHLHATARYSYRQKERNIPNYDSILYTGEQTFHHQLQAEAKATLGAWQLSARAMWACFDADQSDTQYGRLVMGTARYTQPKWQANASLAWFRTDGYYARFYVSESNIQYAWTMPMLYGHGMRGCLLLRYTPSRNLAIAAKYALSYYPGQESIGSGDAQTEGPYRQIWHLQIRWKF